MSDWMKENTFHHSVFSDLEQLSETKQKKGLKISVCFPTLNEESTIAKEIVIIKSELMDRYKLVDQIIVMDSGSTDKTRDIAANFGAEVYLADEVLPGLKPHKGKGENLWKALYVTTGDIIVYIDADIKNIHHRFVYGLVGPLINDDRIKYVKAFYDRPIARDMRSKRPTQGGRVTELVTRPLFSLFFPELAQVIQPLSGEYAGRREILEAIPFPIGYGVETSMLLDIYDQWGLDVIAQVDLDRRVHRNQPTLSLGRMSFGIMQTFFNRIEKMGMIRLDKAALYDKLFQFEQEDNAIKIQEHCIVHFERPPMTGNDDYLQKYHAADPPQGTL